MTIQTWFVGKCCLGTRGVMTVAAFGGLLMATAAEVAAVTVDVAMSKNVYQPNSPVKAHITIADGAHLQGVLRVETFNEQTDTKIDTREYPVTLPADGRRVVPYVIAPTPEPDASYSVVASFFIEANGDSVTTDVARFGVRPANFPEGVPDNLLKADVVELDVPEIQKQLDDSAKDKKPVRLTIGAQEFRVQVEPLELLAPGVEVPGLGRPPTFMGKLVDDEGHVKEPSKVVLTVANGELQGSIEEPEDPATVPPGEVPSISKNSIWIQSLRQTQMTQTSPAAIAAAASTSPSTYLRYRQKDTLPPPQVGPDGHGPGPVAIPPEEQVEAESQLAQASLLADAAALTIRNYQLRVRVVTDGTTDAYWRWQRIVDWASQMYSSYDTPSGVTIQPVSPTDPQVQLQLHSLPTSAAILVTHYVTIPSNTFTGGTCLSNLQFFKQVVELGHFFGGKGDHFVNVAFTNSGNDCGGIAYRGIFSGAVGYALAHTDSGSASYDNVTLMQEIGHVLDAHPTNASYDAHNSDQIRQLRTEFLGLKGCTAMNGSYDPCSFPYPVYTFTTPSFPLQYLAYGISRVGLAR